MESSFNPELTLNHSDRGHLVQMAAMPGYAVMHQIFRSEIDKFIVALLNARPAEHQEVLAAQLMAKAAAQFYEGITDRINEEIVQYSGAVRVTDRPVDPTEGLLDIGYIQQFVEEYE
jgi:hypothetical protein